MIEDRYDVKLTDSEGASIGFIADWAQGGAGLKIEPIEVGKSTSVSTKGDYGVRDANDYQRIIQSDWVLGCGQKTYDHEVDSESAFEDSRCVDVSTTGELKLGPQVATAKSTTVVPVIIAGLKDGSENPLLWRGDTGAKYLKYSKDGITWAAPAADTYDNTGVPTSFCTDGAYVYGCFAGVISKSTIDDTETFSSDASNANLTHCTIASGVMYAAKSTTDQVGSFSGASPPVWSALTPKTGTAINNDGGTTFGLVSLGNFAYWGTTNGMVTKVYKVQYVDGSNDILTQVATFPTGFVGASMYSYLDTVYVGGHFDGDTVTTGLGAIYAIIDDTPVLLTNVGVDKTLDNRILSISCYERHLYFISNGEIWRWDLVKGGYSHWAGPLNSTPALSYSAIAWTGEWTCDVAVGNGAEPDATITTVGTTTAVIIGGEALRIDLQSSGVASRTYTTTDEIAGFDDDTGEMLELEVPANFIDDHNHGTSLSFGIEGDEYRVYASITAMTSSPLSYRVALEDGANLVSISSLSKGAAHTLRLTLKKDGPSGTATARLYADGIQLAYGYATKATSNAKKVWISGSRSLVGATDDHVTISNVRWTDDGAVSGDSFSTLVTGVKIACWRDKVCAACSGYGTTYTSTMTYKTTDVSASEEPPYLLSSRSSGNMPTVDKYFHAIHATLENALPGNCNLRLSGTIDGQSFTTTEDTDLSTETLKVFPLSIIGRTIQYQVSIAAKSSSATLTFNSVLATSKIYIDDLVFTAHATTTDESSREFAINGTDEEDAEEFCTCVNDATYGVPGVTASNVGNVITLASTSEDGFSLVESLSHVDSVINGSVATPVVTEIAVLFRPTPKQTKLYSYYLKIWDEVESNITGKLWDVNPETACDFLEDNANTTVLVERKGTSYTGTIESLQYIEAPPSQRSSHRTGLYRVDIRRLT